MDKTTKKEVQEGLAQNLNKLSSSKLVKDDYSIDLFNLISAVDTIADSMSHYLNLLEEFCIDKVLPERTQDIIKNVQSRAFQIQTIVKHIDDFIDTDGMVFASNIVYFYNQLPDGEMVILK